MVSQSEKADRLSCRDAWVAMCVICIMLAPAVVVLLAPKPRPEIKLSKSAIYGHLPVFNRSAQAKFLNDPEELVSNHFEVPPEIFPIVVFWYEIYSKYSSLQAVFHHKKYPWIILDVYDTEPILRKTGSLFRARFALEKNTRRHKGKLRRKLKKLAQRKDFKNLSTEEQQLYDKLAEVPGPRSKVFLEAARNLRTQEGQLDHFLLALQRSHSLLPDIEKVFLEQGLPVELSRIPFLESSFNNKATSSVGAAGVWQLMPRTARQYLKVTRKKDERLDTMKATRAAASLLKTYYKTLGDWPLAVSAYNQGIGNIFKAIRHQDSRDISQIVVNYRSRAFRFASSSYYPCFLAAIHIYAYREQIFEMTLKAEAT